MVENLDEFHWHEALDRTNMVLVMFSEHVGEHPAVSQTPELKEAADKITVALGNLYQEIGNHCFKEEAKS